MTESPVKNAWDLLAQVRQRLDAGAASVMFAWSCPPHSTSTKRTWAVDDQQVTYDLADDFPALLEACLEAYISYSMRAYPGEPATLTFGYQLPPLSLGPPFGPPPGALVLDLRGHDVKVSQLFNPNDPANPILSIDATPPAPPAADE
ncbi:MAG: hypothetical protein H7Z21_02865 [Hymenobacter sp.]|nr:hypothetical protein [Hymenobacter sp.]